VILIVVWSVPHSGAIQKQILRLLANLFTLDV